MSVKSFVILPYDFYVSLEEKSKNSKATTMTDSGDKMMSSDDPSVKSDDLSDAESVVLPEPKPSGLSTEVKKMAKRKQLRPRYFEKLLAGIRDYDGDQLNLPNISELVRNACNQGKRHIKNEEAFYAFLAQHNLFSLVKNIYKLKKYNKNWFKIE